MSADPPRTSLKSTSDLFEAYIVANGRELEIVKGDGSEKGQNGNVVSEIGAEYSVNIICRPAPLNEAIYEPPSTATDRPIHPLRHSPNTGLGLSRGPSGWQTQAQPPIPIGPSASMGNIYNPKPTNMNNPPPPKLQSYPSPMQPRSTRNDTPDAYYDYSINPRPPSNAANNPAPTTSSAPQLYEDYEVKLWIDGVKCGSRRTRFAGLGKGPGGEKRGGAGYEDAYMGFDWIWTGTNTRGKPVFEAPVLSGDAKLLPSHRSNEIGKIRLVVTRIRWNGSFSRRVDEKQVRRPQTGSGIRVLCERDKSALSGSVTGFTPIGDFRPEGHHAGANGAGRESFDTHPEDQFEPYFTLEFRYGTRDVLKAQGYLEEYEEDNGNVTPEQRLIELEGPPRKKARPNKIPSNKHDPIDVDAWADRNLIDFSDDVDVSMDNQGSERSRADSIYMDGMDRNRGGLVNAQTGAGGRKSGGRNAYMCGGTDVDQGGSECMPATPGSPTTPRSPSPSPFESTFDNRYNLPEPVDYRFSGLEDVPTMPASPPDTPNTPVARDW